jgi:hypothetical protein
LGDGVQFFCKNGSPYQLKAADLFQCRVIATAGGKVEVPYVVEPASLVDQTELKVSFTAKVSGQYLIRVKINEFQLLKEDGVRMYLPGWYNWQSACG